uniref:TP53-binding protein 1 n=1 Tax=Scophthalmus maximus TaxID=52904 RepID=A0A8D2ZWV2_SCOMX
MDPGGSELDSSLPQPENPCLIVEDSQPDTLLARRLSDLQPAARSPVLVRRDLLCWCSEKSIDFYLLFVTVRSEHELQDFSESGEQIPEVLFFWILHLFLGRCTRESDCIENSSVSPVCRSEVSSSSSSDSPAPSGRTLSVQALLHSQGLQASGEQEQQDGEVPSSQDDLFDTDKTGAAVDSTVSEPEQQQRQPTATPSCTLRLLHLSGQGTLAQDSLSQSSVDYVAPTPDNFSHTPLIVPSSPTGPENEHGADEPMDTSLPPDDGAGEKEEQPMEMEAASKPHPSASTPVSQNPPGFALERTFSLPSQPEFSHVCATISFHFTLPKEGELIGPAPGTTPPLINQLKQRLRHSTPIGGSLSSEQTSLTRLHVAVQPEDGTEQGDGKLSLRMKLVTPVGEGSSETFSLQKPALSEEDGSVVKVTTVSKAVTSPSVFSRVRQVHRQREAEGDSQPAGNASPGEPESPSFRRTAGPSHCRHVRTVQEVRTTVTRIITDVYYEDGKEVERKVREENEEPVVDCHVLDSDISPCRTGSSSMTSGDLGDISSLSSKASSLQHSSGGTSSSTGFTRPDFLMPSGRGARSFRGGGSFQRIGAQQHSSSEDQPFTRMLPPRLPASPTDGEPPSRSDSLRSSPEEGGSAAGRSSFVGLRVVAKWSSNGYFYSGRIVKDAGEGSFRLRFDDGYECEVEGKDILLCDPIPLETEVTALLEDEYFSIGVVRGHKTEGQELFYSVERDGQQQWYNRTSVILSLEQGNRLREQHSLGPYEPAAPLAKASDISLDNLVEGKRRRRVTLGGPDTPNRSSSSSPRTPGPSGKRKLRTTSEDDRTPAKRGRRGPGARAVQRVGACNTSGSGTDLPGPSGDAADTHGPLPQNASLFLGFAFMLTASSESDRLTNLLTAGDDDDDYVQTSPYNKAYTESQLQAGGGFVLPDFNEEQCKAAYQSLLIADQHCRTRKYLQCLASGVPCVSHVWVRDCCKENKLLNYRNYLLPAGVGPDAAVVEWHPRCSPFKALRVLLVFEEPVELWAQLVTMGGASSVRQFQGDKDGSDIPTGKYDVVVTDRACPPLVEKSVTSQDVPLVSPEWIIESVIGGERLGFRSKPQYRHDYAS